MSTVTKDRSQGLHESRNRRFYSRSAPQTSTKIVFGTDDENPGTLLNLSENGVLVSTLLPIAVDSVHRVALALYGFREPLRLYLRTIWSDVPARKSGLQLLNLSEDDRIVLRAWALSQAEAARTDTENGRARSDDAPPQSSEMASQANLRAPAPLTRSLIPAQLESPVGAPMRYFWVAALATIFLGATWATVKIVGPTDAGKSITKGARSKPPNRESAKAKSMPALAASPAQPDVTMPSGAKTTSPSAVAEGQQEQEAVTNQFIAAMPPAGPSIAVHSSANGGITEPQHRASTSKRISRSQSEEALGVNDLLDSEPTDSETQTAPAGNRGTQLEEKEAAAQPAARESTDSASVNSQPAGTVSPQVPMHAMTTGPTAAVSGNPDSLPRVLSRDSASSRSPAGNPTSAISRISKAPPADLTALDPKPDSKIENTRPLDSRPMDNRAATPNPNDSGRGSFETSARPSLIDRSRSAPPPALTTQTLEVPALSAAAYVHLPGESVVRSPSVTIHIQRSVWVKASHWLWRSHKQVQLGELAARVDPQMPLSGTSYGSITVLATVEKDGQVSSVRPLYGSPQFLGSVMRAVREWRYRPTYVGEKPVETLARIEINFHAPQSSYSR